MPLCCLDLVVKKKNTFLLVKRRDYPAKNCWWFPGGRILFGEKFKQAIRRKLKEELRIENFKNIKFLGIGETFFKKGYFGNSIFSVNNVFLVEISKEESTKIEPDKTILNYKWFRKIPKNIHPYLKKFLKLTDFR